MRHNSTRTRSRGNRLIFDAGNVLFANPDLMALVAADDVVDDAVDRTR